MMRMDVLTLFPEMFEGVFGSSILGKAQQKGIITLNAINFRQYSGNKHCTVDDMPYGGGGGMVLKAEPIFAAVEDLLAKQAVHTAHGDDMTTATAAIDDKERATAKGNSPRIILMCPQGESFTQRKAEELAQEEHLIFICGHYEGYDERIREHLVTDEISIGDYVLTGGELPAMTVIDSVSRLLPGVLGNASSAVSDSFSTGLLEYPHYTRPAEFRGWKVPDVLISGHHANVAVWRRQEALRRTFERRPDLLDKIELSKEDIDFINRLKLEKK